MPQDGQRLPASLPKNATIYFNTTNCPQGDTPLTPLDDRFALDARHTYVLTKQAAILLKC